MLTTLLNDSSAEELLPLADDLPVIIWMTRPDAYCFYLNQRWYDYTGQSPETALGLGWLTVVHPDDAQRSGDIFLEANQNQKPFSLDYRLRAADGSYRWMKDTGRPRFDQQGTFLGYAGSVVDIHELKMTQERLRLAIESTDLGTWDFYPHTGELIWSERCKELFGLPPDAYVDYAVFLQGIHPDDRDKTDAVVQSVLQPGNEGFYDIEYRTVGLTDGKLRWLRAIGQAYFGDDGTASRFIGAVLDITQSKLANELLEQRVADQTHQLQVANAELKRSNSSLQSFAYIASHDLQEPLRKIQSFGDMLKSQYADQLNDGVVYLERMQSAAGRMSALIRDLLTLSRISVRQDDTTPVSLNEVVGAVLSDLDLAIQESKATVTVSPLPTLEGDRSQLGQLFQNLLSNALKFHRPGESPAIHISARQIRDADLPSSVQPTRPSSTYYRIDVADNGIGFDAKYIDRIFEVFQRLHTRNQYEGTGIGLAICEKVVANHGGAITAASEPNQGATFSVYLPA
ncbi:PAS domain S-box protein [Fibrisoma montanum]|uniref:histidine kinase n=1 Tax=Fibrisoma montanum TaxID=2305895 RepID=A0A418MHX6_9BACT|nr:PAS domain-containing protein [Fibrisoma montanum]RIV27022.1 PAS domain S-box protein [Fibrisoma montanum]